MLDAQYPSLCVCRLGTTLVDISYFINLGTITSSMRICIMAKKKERVNADVVSDNNDDVKVRNFKDYTFEEHHEDGTVTPIGITLNYPMEAEKVKAFLEERKNDLGITGKIRICVKRYT